MQMSNAEIVGKYKRADDKKAQISILAELNGCDKETIKQILLEGGVPESELPKARSPKPKTEAKKEAKEPKYKPGVYSNVEKKAEATVIPVLDDEAIPGAITGGEGDVEGYEPMMPTYRPIEQILADGPQNEREAERLERHKLIPEPVKELCMAEKDRLIQEILKLEKRHDQIADYLNGEAVC